MFNDCFIANFLENVAVKKITIGDYLTKLRVEYLGFTFLAHPVQVLRYKNHFTYTLRPLN